MKQKYWIEIYHHEIRENHGQIRTPSLGKLWFWKIRSINGRTKASSSTNYNRRSLCYNDAKALSEYTGLELRENGKKITNHIC